MAVGTAVDYGYFRFYQVRLYAPVGDRGRGPGAVEGSRARLGHRPLTPDGSPPLASRNVGSPGASCWRGCWCGCLCASVLSAVPLCPYCWDMCSPPVSPPWWPARAGAGALRSLAVTWRWAAGPEDRPLSFLRAGAGGPGGPPGPEADPGTHGLPAAPCCLRQGEPVGPEGAVPEQKRWVSAGTAARAQNHQLRAEPASPERGEQCGAGPSAHRPAGHVSSA